MTETSVHIDTAGIEWFTMRVTRGLVLNPEKGGVGLVLEIKADPRIEAFIKSLGSGETRDVTDYGPEWTPLSGQPIKVYSMKNSPVATTACGYVLNLPGYSLMVNPKAMGLVPNNGLVDPDLVNLSFLRIVGISEGDGVKFGISGAFSTMYMRKLLADINVCTKSLIRDFITPMRLSATIYS